MNSSTKTPDQHRSDTLQLLDRITELETRLSYMDETVDTLNEQITHLSADFTLARQAMQLMNRRLEQLAANTGDLKSSQDDAPPPHY
ncbi:MULTISPECIES: SlyX family protein [unclassified Oceanobacter]|uniref:SlyX family protein n=2 Tax=Gammaproteobacteria TaxID=1236 RepID=UPI0026E2B219|nr:MULTISPECIES: SlyX family protein [unclassified Oceanobacter]MDO6682567.1 SlyX family protein [Oceanobacter sp. 5_MG-2023]MDP2506783.1 SlyX family protein [Oceanobacter sp. 3_MG-2023]MDP2608800.1 SlyX family protein [Oceanobacter sp. 1_MG-2023]MDP2611958.1 SlyX family protein [Oceanobacter sp. 2_MG-2023]